MNTKNTLTVDASAHLRKLASNYYRSDALNIIELIRSSLKRNASKIKLNLKKNTVIIEDNGNGISQEQKARLIKIADTNISQLEREEGILLFVKEFGIDILVIFSFHPLDIKIENTYNTSTEIIIIKDTGITLEKAETKISGTKFIIKRKNYNLKFEKKILSEYCRNLGNRIEINRKPVVKKPIIKNMIVSINIDNEGRDNEIAISKSGKLCKLWTLNYGIPVSIKTFPNVNGYIFELVSNKSLPNNEKLAATAEKLYTHLINRYEFYQAEIKQRIKELVFIHYKITKNPFLLIKLNSFTIFESNTHINISILKEMSTKKTLYAVLNIKDLKGINTNGKTVLILDQLEIELLINYLKMNIVFLQKITNQKNIKNSLYYNLISRIKVFISKKLIKTNKIIILTKNDNSFIQDAGDLLSKNKHFKYLYPEAKKINIKIINQRLFIPSCIINQGEVLNIFIFKKHEIIKKALELYKLDKNNLEWLLPQIFFTQTE